MHEYQINEIGTDVYQLFERLNPPLVNAMYLVIGQERAALIDTGSGIYDIDEAVRALTSLPVTLLLTHIHSDHVGGSDRFSIRYAGETAEAEITRTHSRAARLTYLQNSASLDTHLLRLAEERLYDLGQLSYRPLQDGMAFDLGGRTLTAHALPGHTRGCMLFTLDEGGVAFTGDAVGVRIWLHVDEATRVQKFHTHLKQILERQPTLERFYCAHREAPLTRRGAMDVLACCQEILQGAQGRPINTRGRSGMLHFYKNIGIAYHPDRLY